MSPTPTPLGYLNLIRRFCLLLWIAFTAATVPVAVAQPSALEFDLPAGNMSSSLETLARQAGLVLEVDPALIANKQTPALRGTYSLEQALQRLLSGSGLVGVVEGSRLRVLQHSAEAVLPTVQVKSSMTGYSVPPAEGYRATHSATATKTDVPILQTPASVQVVPLEVLRDQQALTMDAAVKNVSGVYQNMGPDGNTGDNFLIRGFNTNSYGGTYRDGVKDFSRSPAEMAGLERVEVLKGPAAILYGRLEPGGLINRVSKEPLAQGFTEVSQQLGTDSLFRTTLDSTGQLPVESLLYRVNVARDDSDGYKDYTHDDRLYIAPQVTWLIGERAELNAGIEYLDEKRSWALTYGTIGDDQGPVNVPIETNLHDKDDFYEQDSLTYRLRGSFAFTDDWQLRSQVSYFDRDSRAEGTWIDAADADGNYERTYWGWDDERVDSGAANLELLGHFSTGPVKHTLLVGTDYFTEDHNSGGWSYGGTPVISNIHNPVYVDNPPYDQDRDVDEWCFNNEHLGFYVQDQLALFEERLHVLLGARRDQAEYESAYAGSPATAEDANTSYRAGVLYQPTQALSLYTSYVQGFGSPQPNYNAVGNDQTNYEPEESHQLEAGLKYAFATDAMFSLAWFELVKDNMVRGDPLDPTITILAGEATSRGLELDISGKLTRSLSFLLAYAYTDTRVLPGRSLCRHTQTRVELLADLSAAGITLACGIRPDLQKRAARFVRRGLSRAGALYIGCLFCIRRYGQLRFPPRRVEIQNPNQHQQHHRQTLLPDYLLRQHQPD